MALNSGFAGAGEEGNDVDNPQSQPDLHSDQQHIIKLTKYLLKDKWLQKNSDLLENEIRKIVRPVVEYVIQQSSLTNSRPLQGESRKYKLEFKGTFPRNLFTENKLVAANEGLDASVQIQLLDAASEQPVTDGPLSSKKVEIVALHGHFKAELLEDWTKSDFCRHIVTERDNKRPLLVGQCVIALRNGIGLVDNVRFTDNSCWVRSKRFRLGAKLVAEQDQVKEAVSSPIQVKDRRGESSQKHKTPSPDDEVWRLPWISKSGKTRKKLEEHNIRKVKDFVTQYYNDQSLLRNILKSAPKKWNETIEQAITCYPKNACANSSAMARFNIPNELQVAESYNMAVGEHMHQLDQFMTQDISLLGGVLAESCSNVHLSYDVDDLVPSLLPATMPDVQTSNWVPNQPTGAEGLGVFYSNGGE